MRLRRVDLGEIEHAKAMTAMVGWVGERRADRAPDRLFLLGHPPIVTYGSRTAPGDLPALGDVPAVPVDRGGLATYHGPGQLVGYLVVDVRARGPVDVVRWVEHALIDACAALGFAAERRDTPPGSPSLVGVWSPDHRKLASIGMRIRGGVTSHGFALNVDPDLRVFDRFVACGMSEVTATSLAELAAESGRRAPTAAAVGDAVAAAFGAVAAEAAARTPVQHRSAMAYRGHGQSPCLSPP
jgi:lipoate-protein ligase B